MNDNVKTPVVVGLDGKPIDGANENVNSVPSPRTFSIVDIDHNVYEAGGFLGVTPTFVAVATTEGQIEFVISMDRLVVAQVKSSNLHHKSDDASEE